MCVNTVLVAIPIVEGKLAFQRLREYSDQKHQELSTPSWKHSVIRQPTA